MTRKWECYLPRSYWRDAVMFIIKSYRFHNYRDGWIGDRRLANQVEIPCENYVAEILDQLVVEDLVEQKGDTGYYRWKDDIKLKDDWC